MDLVNIPNKELTPEREDAIREYLGLQEDFVLLAKKGVMAQFKINYTQEELDVDALTETQQNKLDNCKDEESREKMLKDLPKHLQEYPALLVRPYVIIDMNSRQETDMDELETNAIEVINTGLKGKIELYTALLEEFREEAEKKD